MKSTHRLLFGAGTVLALLLIAGAMFIVGRGHTVYIDNKTFEHEGQTYGSFYKAVVYANGAEAAKLAKRERGMVTWMGQDYRMVLEVTRDKGGQAVTYPVELKLPYHLDGIVLNLPAMMAGLPVEKYMTEFVAQDPQDAKDEEVVIDEFAAPAEI